MLHLRYEELFDRYENTAADKAVHHCCVLCGAEAENQKLNRCPQCGGAMDAIYDLASAEVSLDYNPLQRYFSLLPVKQRENLTWLGEGNTPCIHAERLGRHLGLSQLYLKDETSNPTRSTKDRIASVGLSRYRELGIRHLVIASTGNSSTAYARGVQLVDGFEVDIFVGQDFVNRLNYVDHPRVNTHVADSDFVSAGSVAKEHADRVGAFFEGGFFSLSRREGLKLAYLEAFDQMPAAPRYVFQAVSSGMGLLGAYKGALEYKRLGRLPAVPSFMAVQQASCSPMATAFAEGADKIQPYHIIQNPTGLAAAILRGDPTQSYPYIHEICASTHGQILAADETEMRAARQLLLDLEGIHACFASATAVAGMIKLAEAGLLEQDAPILVNLTGADRAVAPVPTKLLPVAVRR